MTSAPQTIALSLVYDYEYSSADPTNAVARPVVNALVRLTLFADQAINTAPAAALRQQSVQAYTDNNGYWSVFLEPAANYSPTSYWLVETSTRTFRITGAAGQASATLAP
jgi:hypothetical protein